MRKHLLKRAKRFLRELGTAGCTNPGDAGTNSSTSVGNLLIGCAYNSLLEVSKPRGCEDKMGMGIDKARQHRLVGAINLPEFVFIPTPLEPGMTQHLALLARGNNASTGAENRSIGDEADVAELAASARQLSPGKRQQLRYVGEEQHGSV